MTAWKIFSARFQDGEDDDDGDEACQDEDDDLLEFFVKREQRPLGLRAPKSFLPLHRLSSHASCANERLTPGKITMDERHDHGAFTHR